MKKLLTRRAPKSIAGRLTLGLIVLVAIAVIAAALSTGFVLSRFIRGQIDQRLSAQIALVAAALNVSPDATSVSVAPAPPFDRPLEGWYWKAEFDGRTFTSPALLGQDFMTLAKSLPSGRRGAARWSSDSPDSIDTPANGFGPGRQPLYQWVRSVPVNGKWATITATAPAHALYAPLRDAIIPVALSVLALGLLLAAASIVQLRLGLKPLGKLRDELEQVRAGDVERINGEQPRELAPLVGEINTLLDQNAEGLRRARAHVSNLGHSLNTPLAALAVSLGPTKKDEERRELVEEMQARIRHHLARARAAALHGASYASTDIGERAHDLVSALGKIYADRKLTVEVDIPTGLAVACEPQDVDEILGNILDNAFKWAKSGVSLSASRRSGMAAIGVSDDGPGVETEQLAELARAGHRLDEAAPGHGFGLAIARELAELYGGSLNLSRSASGGLRVDISLPSR